MKDDGSLSKDINHILKKNIPEVHQAIFLRRLNRFLTNLAMGRVESVHFFQNAIGVKVNKGDLLKNKKPVKYEVHATVGVPFRNTNTEKKKIRSMKRRLQNHVKKWIEPSFMEYEESKLLKKQLKDLHHLEPIAPVKVIEGDEAIIKCIPPYGVPIPTVTWKKNGKLIEVRGIQENSWSLRIKKVVLSNAGNYTCCAKNSAKERNVTTRLEVIGRTSIEEWVGQHFSKSHHSSIDEENKEKLEVDNSLELTNDDDDSVEKEVQKNGLGKALVKGLLEERNVLPMVSNDVLSKLTKKQKKDYLDAEREWEMKLTQETQRLLDKLQPADAYIIPDVPIFDGTRFKKLKGLDAATVIKKELEDVARRKIILSGNENLDDEKDEPISSPSVPKNGDAIKYENELKNKLGRDSFQNELAEEEEEWIGIERSAWSKIKDLEKYLKQWKKH